MKKVVSIIALLTVATPAFSATRVARPSYLTRNSNGAYDVTYSYQDKAKSGWYGSVRAELSFLNWKNEYSTDIPGAGDYSEKFSFKPVFSPNIAFGKKINYFWRAEVEAGYITQYSDTDEGYEFKLSAPYVMANGYYDFNNGLYLGAGIGIAMPKMELIDDAFKSGNNPKWSVSPMLGLMAGYAYKLDDNLVLDLRYRLAGFSGSEQEREWVAGTMIGSVNVGGMHLKNKIGLVLDNSISIGIRYEF